MTTGRAYSFGAMRRRWGRFTLADRRKNVTTLGGEVFCWICEDLAGISARARERNLATDLKSLSKRCAEPSHGRFEEQMFQHQNAGAPSHGVRFLISRDQVSHRQNHRSMIIAVVMENEPARTTIPCFRRLLKWDRAAHGLVEASRIGLCKAGRNF